MAKTYFYEYLGSCDSREVTYTDFGIFQHNEPGYDSCCGNFTNVFTDETVNFSVPSSAPVDIDIYFSYWIHYDDPWTSNDNFYTSFVTLPAGQLSVNYVFYNNWLSEVYQNFCPGGGCARENTNIYDFAFIDQPIIPETCGDPGCFLGLTGVTSTAPSQRGASDGSIYAATSGATGTNVHWFLNTVLQTGTGITHTFSSLSSGDYFIKATEDNCFAQDTVTVNQGEFRTGPFNITSPTETVKAVENPIILSLRTATASSTPAYSVNTFTITGSIADVVIDFSLTFPYLYNAQFLSKGFPDRSTYFLESILRNKIGSPVGTNTNDEIATSLSEVFQKDAILSRIYYITSSGTTITLTAKEYGEGFDLDIANVTITGSNVVLNNVVPGISQFDGQIISNYSLYAELFVNEVVEYGETPVDGDYHRVAELELPFAKNNSHQFDLGPTLKNFTNSPIFNLNFTGVTFLPNYVTSYFCKYGEKYPLLENTNTKKKRTKGQTTVGWAVNAALNFEDPNDMSVYIPTGFTTISGLAFINTAPQTKYSHRHGDEILYFALPENYQYPMFVAGNITMYNGTTYNDIKFYDIKTGSTNSGAIVGVSVGYEALNLSTYESSGDKIRKVDIQVHQTIGGLTGYTYTNLQSYLLEIDEQPDNFNVAFLNKLGTYETHSFYGELVADQEIGRSTYQKGYEVDNNGAAAVGFEYNSIFNTDYTKVWRVNTGILDEANYDYLIGLLQSNKIYHYDDIHRSYLIPTTQVATKSTNDNEFSLQITFKETISENNVTN